MPFTKGKPAWNKDTSQGWTDKRGYRWLYVVEGGRRVARREHRVLMERHLGRKLEPWEIVHHRDGDTANNAIENLEVMEFGAHTGAHSLGRRKDADARRSMEAFALMREELKRERLIKADLLSALTDMIYWARMDTVPVSRSQEFEDQLAQARAAISKATGATP